MIKDWNRNEVNEGEVFHFKNSLEPFILIDGGHYFLNINTWESYAAIDLNFNGYAFYTKEDDKDFMGVDVDGRLEWVE